MGRNAAASLGRSTADAEQGVVIEIPEAFSRPLAESHRAIEESPNRLETSVSVLDPGRTVRSGYAYDFDSTDAVPPSDAERAARVKAELGDEPLHGIEKRLAYRSVKRAFDIAFSAAVLICFS